MVKKDGESHNEEGEEGGQDKNPGGSTLGLLGGDVPLGPNPPPPPHPMEAVFQKQLRSIAQSSQNKTDLIFLYS